MANANEQAEGRAADRRAKGHAGETPRPDHVLRKEVCERLSQDDELDLSHADVLVADGIVLLLGSVPEFAMKRRIEHVCEAVPGVREIHDQLLVGQVNADADPGGLHTEAPRAGFRGPGS